MPCSDSSSSMVIFLDKDENFQKFEYAKITCGSEIKGNTGMNAYFQGKPLSEVLDITFDKIVNDLNIDDEEGQFILYMEWDALRSAIGQYLGIDNPNIDISRSQVTSVEHKDEGTEIALVILPPKELPKILPCSLNKGKEV